MTVVTTTFAAFRIPRHTPDLAVNTFTLSCAVIVMDRENLWARGWSHVLSTTNDISELKDFAERMGAPPSALHLRSRWPHLDLKLLPREQALSSPDVRVFERTPEMLRFLKTLALARK